MNQPPRLLPSRPLPDYSYVPGLWPHPHLRPGHGDALGDVPLLPPDPSRWQDCDAYLAGLDLWNYGYYWEAHEAWELLWHAAGRKGPPADFFKGLIQLAVAGVKAREGRIDSVRRHSLRAHELFLAVHEVTACDTFFGLPLRFLAELAEEIAAHPPASIETEPAKVRVVFASALTPSLLP